MSVEHTAVLRVDGLSTYFPTSAGVIRAVDGLSFTLQRNRCLALIGESGAGKSVTALSLLRLVPPPGRITGGKVLLGGCDLLTLPRSKMRQIRGEEIALIFQDPLASFNPVFTIGRQITETILAHSKLSPAQAREKAAAQLSGVGLPAGRVYHSYPFQLSGGMRQRAAIALALSLHPQVLIADEPTSFLDVTLQRQILGELKRQLDECCFSLMLITHDLAAAAAIADSVAVLYAGRIVECGPLGELYREPGHPYTMALLRSHPSFKRGQRLQPVQGSPPSPVRPPAGCAFHPRCPQALPRCRWERPLLAAAGDGRLAACHRIELPKNGAAAAPEKLS